MTALRHLRYPPSSVRSYLPIHPRHTPFRKTLLATCTDLFKPFVNGCPVLSSYFRAPAHPVPS
eukprot:625380-Rhodomonas_salina.1